MKYAVYYRDGNSHDTEARGSFSCVTDNASVIMETYKLTDYVLRLRDAVYLRCSRYMHTFRNYSECV